LSCHICDNGDEPGKALATRLQRLGNPVFGQPATVTKARVYLGAVATSRNRHVLAALDIFYLRKAGSGSPRGPAIRSRRIGLAREVPANPYARPNEDFTETFNLSVP